MVILMGKNKNIRFFTKFTCRKLSICECTVMQSTYKIWLQQKATRTVVNHGHIHTIQVHTNS